MEIYSLNEFEHFKQAQFFYDQQNYRSSLYYLNLAVKQAPEHDFFWLLLAKCHDKLKNEMESKSALTQYELIRGFNEELKQATTLFKTQKYSLAEEICRNLLMKVPNETRVLRLMAKIAACIGRTDIAVHILNQCLDIKPQCQFVHQEYIFALYENKQPHALLEHYYKYQAYFIENTNILAIKASAEVKQGQYTSALASYQHLVSVSKNSGISLIRCGNVLKILGRTEEAIKSYKQALQYTDAQGEAYWSLANLKSYIFSEIEKKEMQEILDKRNISKQDKIFILFALGKLFEDQKKYHRSFTYYHQANQLCFATKKQYRIKDSPCYSKYFTSEVVKRSKENGHIPEAPIFIVGLPRSGSTLVEQILSSHSEVDGTMELTEIISIARKLNFLAAQNNSDYLTLLTQLPKEQRYKLAWDYLNFVRKLRGKGECFIDKQPLNFHHIGLIKILFPQAKIIDVRRNPMAVGYSLYKQFFAEGNEFSYDLESIAHYYNYYIDVMGEWNRAFPNQILTIHYEDLVADFQSSVNKLLAYCELKTEPSCFEYYKNKRAVATASSEQVRQPIYDSSLVQWKNYEEYLQPLRDNLAKNL